VRQSGCLNLPPECRRPPRLVVLSLAASLAGRVLPQRTEPRDGQHACKPTPCNQLNRVIKLFGGVSIELIASLRIHKAYSLFQVALPCQRWSRLHELPSIANLLLNHLALDPTPNGADASQFITGMAFTCIMRAYVRHR
jgi:hypothetical protein